MPVWPFLALTDLVLVALAWITILHQRERAFRSAAASGDMGLFLLGHSARRLFGRRLGTWKVGPGIYVFVGANCVGSMRMDAVLTGAAESAERPITIVQVRSEARPGDYQKRPAVVWAPSKRQRLRTPQAVFVGRDGAIWRAQFVNSPRRWALFLESCPVDVMNDPNTVRSMRANYLEDSGLKITRAPRGI